MYNRITVHQEQEERRKAENIKEEIRHIVREERRSDVGFSAILIGLIIGFALAMLIWH